MFGDAPESGDVVKISEIWRDELVHTVTGRERERREDAAWAWGRTPPRTVAAWLAKLPPEEVWEWRAPPALLPVPAAEVSPLRGR